jgi:hypothetical protein
MVAMAAVLRRSRRMFMTGEQLAEQQPSRTRGQPGRGREPEEVSSAKSVHKA